MKNEPIYSDVAVLGGGIAGLAAADTLVNQNKKVVVLEQENAVGGMCRSFQKQGFIFDLGGHRFLPHQKEVTEFAAALFKDEEFGLRDRSSHIYLKGKYLLYPPEFSDILKNLGLFTCGRAAIDSAFFRLKHSIQKKPEISLKDWLMNRFGPTLYDIYFGPYSFKLWGRPTSYISAEWAPQRISIPTIGVALKSLLLRKPSSAKTYAREFFYPDKGIGELPDRMAKKIVRQGGAVFTDNKIVKVEITPRNIVITTRTSSNETRTFITSQLVSSIPLPEFIMMLAAQVPQDVITAAQSLSFRSVRFLNLMVDMPPITKDTWVYVPERKYIFFRIQEFPNWHPNTAPKNKTSLTLEISCEKNGQLWVKNENELLSACVKDLKKIGINIENKIIGHFSTYAEHAYPVYALRYQQHLKKIYDFIKTLDTVILCGRQGLFRYLNMDAAIENGFCAAKVLDDAQKRKAYLTSDEKKDYLEKDLYLRKK